MTSLTVADLNTTITHEPRIQDLRLAEVLGFEAPHRIRALIERHAEALARFGEVSTTVVKTSAKGGRPGTTYWLNKCQALFLCTKSETANATEVTIEMVEVFDAYTAGRRGAAPERAPRTIAIVCDGDAPGFAWRERVRIDLDCPRLDPGEPAGVIHPVTGAVVVRRLAAPWTAAGHPDRLGLAHFPGPENHSRGSAVQVVVVGAVRRAAPDRR